MPQVVALGNLLPPDAETDELDSWMYQTVGHQLVAAYASATGLPLLRRRIFGSSKHLVYISSSPCSVIEDPPLEQSNLASHVACES